VRAPQVVCKSKRLAFLSTFCVPVDVSSLFSWLVSSVLLAEMAEWGKGDPRWIVEERPDGTKIFPRTSILSNFLVYFQPQIRIIGIGKKKMQQNGRKTNLKIF